MRDLAGVRLLWDSDWWDGPVSGLADYQGKQFWYQAVWDKSTDDWTVPRRFVLRELTDAELDDEWRRHRLFEQHVSTHSCHHDDDGRPPVWRPQSEHRKFYDQEPRRIRAYETNPIVGEFTLPIGPPTVA